MQCSGVCLADWAMLDWRGQVATAICVIDSKRCVLSIPGIRSARARPQELAPGAQ